MGDFFRNRWWVVAASICGLLVGAGAVNVFAFAVFLKPVTQDLKVGREALSSGLIISSSLGALGQIALGFLLDRYRVRRVMMPGVALYSLGIMAYALMTPSSAMIYLAFALAGVFSAIGSPIPYGVVISLWFDRLRGLAIGVAMAGVGLASQHHRSCPLSLRGYGALCRQMVSVRLRPPAMLSERRLQ